MKIVITVNEKGVEIKTLVLDASVFDTLDKSGREELQSNYDCNNIERSDKEVTTKSADHITPQMITWRKGMVKDFNKKTSGTKFMIGEDGYKYVPQLTFRKSGKELASDAEVKLVENLAGLGKSKDKTTK